MSFKAAILLFFCFSFISNSFVQAQQAPINFHHLNSNHGLADGVVRCIGQDKYGYIWVGTLSGLNRYNGYSVRSFHNYPGETGSVPYAVPYAIRGDRHGNLWFGFAPGLYRFDYPTEKFQLVEGTRDISVGKILEPATGPMILHTNKGIAAFDPLNGKIQFFKSKSNEPALSDYRVNDIALHGYTLFVATGEGLLIHELKTSRSRMMPLNIDDYKSINRIAADQSGIVWAAYGQDNGQLVKIDPNTGSIEKIQEFSRLNKLPGSSITSLMLDRQQRLWITTPTLGLVQYSPQSKTFAQHTHDPRRPFSLSSNHFNRIFQDNQGILWAASEGYGVDYFHPDENLFKVISPSEKDDIPLSSLWARVAAEDKNGNLWMGWGGGLVKQDNKGNYFAFINEENNSDKRLHSNSIRSILADNDSIWIGTNMGVNIYDLRSGKIVFLGGNDSLPAAFYWSIIKDRPGNIWFGTAGSLFYRDARDRKIYNAKRIPGLAKLNMGGVRVIFEDSKGRLWFGTNSNGLVMFDAKRNHARNWKRTEENDSTIIGNTITSITEDKNGIIWAASFIGIVSLDPSNGRFKQYTRKQGLPSIKTSTLLVDEHNRLWIGSTAGLLLLDSSRKYFKSFDLQDGLPVMEFNDQQGMVLKNGRFLMPTMKGFVEFDPMSYIEKDPKPALLLSSVKVHDKGWKGNQNYEELDSVWLSYDQNFISFELAALNYMKPQQLWYAYKLEGFDKDWIYSKERMVNYTNIPGGRYSFRYKASLDPNNWEVPEKILAIRIGTVFYKTTWFWTGVALLVIALLYQFYRLRIRQQQQMHSLQTKAHSLEKEKALVMYENLKQQLNPHFLFNSLTSLSSLIRLDQKLAGNFLDSLSKTYRYILKNRENELVPLAEEIRFAQNYVRLQQTRFETGLEVRINIDEQVQHLKIVPVTLQNLIENAIKHNVIDDERPLLIEVINDGPVLIVRNNLQRKNFVETSNKQGLANLQSLYHYLTDRPVEIVQDEKSFIVKIPLL